MFDIDDDLVIDDAIGGNADNNVDVVVGGSNDDTNDDGITMFFIKKDRTS